jgi:RNA polymerase sigma-70 factor (ECF subfamily)
MSGAQSNLLSLESCHRLLCEQSLPNYRGEADVRPSGIPNPDVAAHQRNPATAVNTHPSEDADRNLDFDALVAKYERKIFNVIYRLIGDYEEATDLTQETFISAFRHYDRFRGEAKVFTWLYQIARNLCINRIRQRDRQRVLRVESLDQPRDPDGDDSLTLEVADWSMSPQNVLEDRELRQRILAAIDSLAPEYREVVVLREFQNMSYNEIVAATGLTLENVKTRLSRARGMLRRKLEPYYRM